MKKTEEILICAGAIDKYGKVHQLLKLAEKCAELNHAVMRYLETREMDVLEYDVLEQVFMEAADVEIMLSQLRVMYPDNEIDDMKTIKLERLKERVNGWRDPDLEAIAERLRVEEREEQHKLPRYNCVSDTLKGYKITQEGTDTNGGEQRGCGTAHSGWSDKTP